MTHTKHPVTVALTGASGARYGVQLVASLLHLHHPVDLLLSDAARLVLQQECDLTLQGNGVSVTETVGRHVQSLSSQPLNLAGLRHFAKDDWLAPLASGSGTTQPMVVCPCSMGTLAAIAHGLSDNLIERAADVAIKEHRPLILVPREAPFSAIHLENMLRLAKLGVVILPAAPGFYHRPHTLEALIQFIVARILDQLKIAHDLVPGWPDKA